MTSNPIHMNKRTSYIDITKGLLTIGMVFAHVDQFLGKGDCNILKVFSWLTGLVSFSGFLFCFGFASWVAYLQASKLPWMSITKTILKCYFAFVISGVAFRTLVNSKPPSSHMLAKIAFLRDIPGYSEFLLSFAIMILLGAIFRKGIGIATDSCKNLLLVCLACLTFTLLPFDNQYDPLLGQLIGGKGFAFYPFIQYLPLFLFGVYMAKHQLIPNRRVSAVSLLLVVTIVSLFVAKIQVSRFPPSAIWIICSAGLCYVYLYLAYVSFTKLPLLINSYLNAIGQNVLFYLIVSNITIFAAKALGAGRQLGIKQVILFYILLMAVLFFIQFVLIDLKRANQSINQIEVKS